MENHWIVVWAEETRCAVHVSKEAAVETIKNLIDSNISIETIFVYESQICRKVTINIVSLD